MAKIRTISNDNKVRKYHLKKGFYHEVMPHKKHTYEVRKNSRHFTQVPSSLTIKNRKREALIK